MPVYGSYTYRVPEAMRSMVAVGKRVLVPFGQRKLSAYVMGSAQRTPPGTQIKAVIDVLDEHALFPETMAGFFRWIAAYYIHPLGAVVQAALPAGLTVAEQTIYQLSPEGQRLSRVANPDPDAALMLSLVGSGGWGYKRIRRKAPAGFRRSTLERWIARGWVVKHKAMSRQRMAPKTEPYATALQFEPPKRKLSPQRQKILALLRKKGAISVAELKIDVPSAARLVRAMAQDLQVAVEARQVQRDLMGSPIAPDQAPEMMPGQAEAVERIGKCLGQGFKTFLLAGITGSGKTEVYLHLSALALAHDLCVLVLVPEIALISQMEHAFRARFGEHIAYLHSGLSAGERYDQWLRIARGEIKIVIGARSAIFAPLARVGLVVVDEEHDDAYKQEGSLRYHARDLAVMRARMDGAVTVLGSATPSVQSTYNVKLGKYHQVTLSQRVDRRTLPRILIHDLGDLKEESGSNRFLTPALVDAMQTALERKEQILLFLNRRGFASTLICTSCGQALSCERCDISLTYHRGSNVYKCHYCGFSRAAGSCCEHCGSSAIRRLGLGTEKLEGLIQNRFPQARVARMDRDTTRRKGATIKILKALRQRRIDILVGTQMVAKGHDYPHITVVGIICADLSLSLPDFRAGERTFQLLAQVAGRAGRGAVAGKVILQTYNPQHFSITAARQQDYDAFYRQEIEFRKALAYPPFTRMVQIRIQGDDQRKTADYALHLGRRCSQLLNAGRYAELRALGPIEAPLSRIANRYRWQLLLKGPRVPQVHGCVRELLLGSEAVGGGGGIFVSIDVDPIFLL